MKENKFKAGFKICPNCQKETYFLHVQVETDEDTAEIWSKCHSCGYEDDIYNQDIENQEPDFYKDNTEALEAKKYLHKQKLNRARVKNHRSNKKTLSGNKITIDYCTNDLIETFKTNKIALNLTSSEYLKYLIENQK